ncbi:lactate racemase domain-containing protein [Tundrisphaera lichenicola]|uniref:lactate racemase domain-containing protein n=1 Tax=Tundrisphaera lichenicola TaxID=2029860 RepID=UPI003EB9B035
MRIAVNFHDEHLDFEIEDERLVAYWTGPDPEARPDIRAMTFDALANPREFPPLLRAVVPGDRVTIPIDPSLPDLDRVLEAVVGVLRQAEVDAITLVAAAPAPLELPEGVVWKVHDPDDRAELAYLATTTDENRIYLNRLLTDADIVIPIGTLGYDPSLGYRGPWSTIYPGMSDRESMTRLRKLATEELPDRERPRATLRESSEVSWLLGCQFQVGVVPGASGAASMIAGLESAVQDAGSEAVDDAWSFRVDDRADVVIAGIGAPGRSTTIEELAEGLATAARLVRRGGKIVALTRVEGEPGPALRRIIGTEDPGAALGRLRGHEGDPDYSTARALASAMAWADVYLHSRLDSDLVDDLGMIAVDRPEEARRLAANAASCTLLSQADRTRVVVTGED